MTTPPVPYSLYEKCLALEERGAPREGVRALRNMFEKATRDYGRTHVGELLHCMEVRIKESGNTLQVDM